MFCNKWQQMGCNNIVFSNVEDLKSGFPGCIEYFLRRGAFEFDSEYQQGSSHADQLFSSYFKIIR